MNTAPHGVHIPLTVAYEGKPVLLETQEHLRTLRAYLDAWIGIYDKAEKLPELPQVAVGSDVPAEGSTESLHAPVEGVQTPEVGETLEAFETLEAGEAEEGSASAQLQGMEPVREEPSLLQDPSRQSEPVAAPKAPLHTMDYIVHVLRQSGGSLPTVKIYLHMRSLGWKTDSPDMPLALRNLENTARKYKEWVTVSKGTISLVKPDTKDTM